ncbi:MAG TPA: phosphoribosylanthranilate isomerase [Thiolinea sp.]|nr:phosphoribosylanthranilate isomerase [Thiolinea sp.]
MRRCRVKVCGITSVEDAAFAGAAGVDAIGLVFYAASSRYVTPDRAAAIAHSLPPFVTCTGLFMDVDRDFVSRVLAAVPLDLLQFHGSESPSFCSSFGLPYIKVAGVLGVDSVQADLATCARDYADARGFLIDSHAPGQAGGTGKTFDWTRVPQDFPRPLVLAGGLRPENVAQAIRMTRIYAVDVSSGVEARPGIKDRNRIEAFMREVRSVECEVE